jgi:hypothetical protein
MKKICALTLCAAALLSLAACGGKTAPAYVIDGVPVSEGIYEYFRREALREAQPTDGKTAAPSAEETAEKRCRQLVALDRYLKEHKITVRADLKSDVASRTEGQWALFGTHYRAMGLTKQDLTRINSFDAQKKQLVQFFYGAGGKHEVAESELKDSFVKLYVGFKSFEGALTTRSDTGETVPLSKEEQAAVLTQFQQMADRANSGTDLDTLYAEYCQTQGLIVTTPLSVSLMKDGDPMYDDDFFEQVSALSHGSTGVIRTKTTVYLLQRVTIAASDEDAFAAYRDEVLYHEELPAIEERVEKLGDEIGRTETP